MATVKDLKLNQPKKKTFKIRQMIAAEKSAAADRKSPLNRNPANAKKYAASLYGLPESFLHCWLCF